MCVVQTRAPFLCLSGGGGGNLSLQSEQCTNNAEKNGLNGVLERVYKIAISTIILVEFLVHLFRVGLAWHTIGIYHSSIYASLEPHHLHKDF